MATHSAANKKNIGARPTHFPASGSTLLTKAGDYTGAEWTVGTGPAVKAFRIMDAGLFKFRYKFDDAASYTSITATAGQYQVAELVEVHRDSLADNILLEH